MINLGFTDLLIFGTPVLTVIFAYSLLKRKEGNGLRITRRRNMLHYVHYPLLIAFVMVTIYAVYLGSRPLVYFFIVAALFVTSVLYEMNPCNRNLSRTSYLTVLILAVSIPMALIAANRFYPRYLWEHEPILQTGSIEQYQQGAIKFELYYYIPIESLIRAVIALIIGPSQLVSVIYSSFILIGVMVGVLVLIRRLTRKSLMGVIGAFLFVSIPSLTTIGRMLSIPYSIFYILLVLLLYESPRASVIGLWIVSLPMIFAHPSGFVAVIALLLPLALLGIDNWPNKGMSSRRIRLSVLTTIFVAFVYWIYTYLISVIAHQGVKFYSTVYSYLSGATAEGGGQGYVPRYYYSGYEVFAYAWAVPIALSAALLVSMFFQFIRKKKLDPSQSLAIVSAFAGLSIIFFAYLSYPGGEAGQYLIPVGYFLLLLSSSVVAAKLFTNRSKKYAVIAASLLAFFILVGTYSPNWAPFEHPNFEAAATIHPYPVYIEAETVTSLTPTGATVYNDYDFPIGGGLYKPVRSVILQVCSGADPTQFARPPITLYGIREERFVESTALENLNTVYTSGYHRILVIQLDH